MLRSRPAFDLFFVSVLVLFLELACIRWFPAHVVFLSFFTNIVLLATFVGMSIGCLLATRRIKHIAYTPYFLVAALFVGWMVDQNIDSFKRMTAVGNQDNPDVIFFGTEAGEKGTVEFLVPIEAVAGLFFILTAGCMVGPGQELGRAFNRMTSRTAAYASDLSGGLAGIALFGVCSYFQIPPVWWFCLISLSIFYFLVKPPGAESLGSPPSALAKLSKFALVVPPVLALFTSYQFSNDPNAIHVAWSPYYRIEYAPSNQNIQTNGTGHQIMIPLGEPSQSPYDLPYMFNNELKRPEFKRILVIGAGSGNDLSRALYWCGPETKIDAVEIDPAIQNIGANFHPNKPYADPRITLHLNDGRNFLKRCEPGTYDLVVFALVDSLILHSGYSSVRLESYLFTQEAFEDVKQALKPDGIFTVYNFMRQGWLVARIREELRTAFETPPVVLTDPPYKKGEMLPLNHNFGSAGIAFFFAGRNEAIEPLRAKFATESFWVPGQVGMSKKLAGRFSATAPTEQYADRKELSDAPEKNRPLWVPLKETKVEESNGTLRPATDDWPFLYVKEPHIPMLTWRALGMTLILSVVLWFAFSPWGKPLSESAAKVPALEYGLLARSFLLGAGFMLIETKAVVQMALLFGSTWIVNSFVFAAILGMAMFGNLFTGWFKPKRLEPYYIGLILAIGLNLLIPLKLFLGLNPVLQAVASCSLVFAPVLFAGVIFPTTFARTSRPDLFFGANVAGALLGGLAENASMVLGFRYLMLVALVFYAGSALFGGRKENVTAPAKPVEEPAQELEPEPVLG